jgi:cytochrome c oxidase assembly protein subunit 15
MTGWARASLLANITIVVTGALVRLTDSGLGCPEWPRCTAESFVPHRALGVHGAIEFGNRMLTYVLVFVAIGTLVAAWRRPERRLAVALAVGIPLQAVIGGITVLTDLNPWVVSLHLVVSMALIAGSVVLVHRVSGGSSRTPSPAGRWLVIAICLAVAVTVYLGTVVTGSGPHAGDAAAPRNGLDPAALSHLHAYAVWMLMALTALAVVVLRSPWAWVLVGIEVVQAAIGVTQYRLDLPIALVAAHLFGAALVVAATTALAVTYLTKGSTAAATNSSAR